MVYVHCRRSLSSLLSFQQLQHGGAAAGIKQQEVQQEDEHMNNTIEDEGVLSWGISAEVSRQVSIKRLRPSLGNCIPFKEFLSSLAAANIFKQNHHLSTLPAIQLMQHLPLSAGKFYKP